MRVGAVKAGCLKNACVEFGINLAREVAAAAACKPDLSADFTTPGAAGENLHRTE